MTDVKRIDSYNDLVIPEGFGVIYEYTILSVGKSYIGQTIDLKARHDHHCRVNSRIGAYLRCGDYNLSILDVVPIEKLDEAEIRYIEANGTIEPNGFNSTIGGRQNDIKQRNQNNSVPRVPSEMARRFKSRVINIAGRQYVMIPPKISKEEALEPDDLMDVWIQYHKF